MSIHQLFEISRRSFRALNSAMNTVGQNVANANTEGYTRRRISLQPDTLLNVGIHSSPAVGSALGTGVSIGAFERLRDNMLLQQSWNAYTSMGSSEEKHRVLSTLQSLFPTQSGSSLDSKLSQFWNAWGDLANDPTDNGVRLALRGTAISLASTLNHLDTEIRGLQTETEAALSSGVDDVNDLLDQIAELNNIISTGRGVGSPNLDAEDRRDILIGQLAEFVPVNVQQGSNNSVRITIDGMTVFDGVTANNLQLDTSGSTPQVLFGDTGVELRSLSEGGGRLSGWLRLLEEHLPDTLTSLDALAESIVKEVNAIHTTGYGPDGSTNINFFFYNNGAGGEEGISAASIRISDEIENAITNIASSSGDPTNGYNDSSIALAIADLRDDLLLNGGTESLETYAINLVTGIGINVDQASSNYESSAILATHLEGMEKGISGVSIEEEMTNLIQFQQAFAATARVLNTAQEMLDTILAL